MKFSDIEKTNSIKMNSKMRDQLGWSLNLSSMTPRAASAMVESIDNKLNAVRASHKLHVSQNDPNYMGMIMARQVLESFITESKDKKIKEAELKVTEKAPVKPNKKKGKEEEVIVDESDDKKDFKFKKKDKKDAKGKKEVTTESLIYRRLRLTEDELGQAQAMLAAKDMVDSMQDMIEDISKMLNEQLPPLTDSIRTAIGTAEADSFKAAASSTLSSLLTTVQTSRDSMDQAVRALSGEPSTVGVPGAPADPAAADMGGEPGFGGADSLDLDNLDDEFGASDAAAGGDLPLGREKR